MARKMRTKRQHREQTQDWSLKMIKDVKDVIARAQTSLLADALGAVSLLTMLVVALHLPSLI